MPHRLSAADPEFEVRFAELLAARRDAEADVGRAVRDIIADVRQRGDAALIDHTRRFDRLELTPDEFAVTAAEIDRAADQVSQDTMAALEEAAGRIMAFHRRLLPADDRFVDDAGVELGHRWNALYSVGLYVPGGRAAYPSSLLMNALPARVAGVARIAMVVPAPEGRIAPLVLAAARLAGISEIYRVGGAQAIAALAYGTETIPAVDKIVGPGNAYVAAAKREVFGSVGIDMIAGPSEILVVADAGNDPDWIAADLLSQAEHDERAQAVLVTDDRDVAAAVEAALEARLAALPKAEIAARSWRDHGAIILVEALEQAPALINRLAPEHVEIAVADPDRLLVQIRHAGAVFLGRHTPEAIGDYVAGPNHVLPTSRSARFSSGLSVADFMTRTTLVRCDAASLSRIARSAVALAEAEGLDAHAQSLMVRLGESGRAG